MSNIVHIASEIAPIAKEGGLGDVILGLNRHLRTRGHDNTVILPFYDHIDHSLLTDLTCLYDGLKTFYDGDLHNNRIWSAQLYDLPIYLIEPELDFFRKGQIYGCLNDTDRFLYFCRAALGVIQRWQTEKRTTDVIHCHDWHTAAVLPLYRDIFHPKGLNALNCVFTVHNFQYQGQCSVENLVRIGLEDNYLLPEKMLDNHHPNTINLLKGGLTYADAISTVSPRHAEEVLTPEGGHGLDSTLRNFQHKFRGITNGIDYTYWNPANDPLIPIHFSNTLDKPWETKFLAKKALQKEFGLAERNAPLVGAVSRLVPQKGIDLLKQALFRTLEKGGQFVLLGSCPIPEILADFKVLQKQFCDHPDVHLLLNYCEKATHMLFAATDIIVVPSLFEPCGLTQQIALRYGAIPIVRKTGGLMNTIRDVDYDREGNGYVFNDPDFGGLHSALDRAISCYNDTPDRWYKMMHHAMLEDCSWHRATEEYLQLYDLQNGVALNR